MKVIKLVYIDMIQSEKHYEGVSTENYPCITLWGIFNLALLSIGTLNSVPMFIAALKYSIPLLITSAADYNNARPKGALFSLS